MGNCWKSSDFPSSWIETTEENNVTVKGLRFFSSKFFSLKKTVDFDFSKKTNFWCLIDWSLIHFLIYEKIENEGGNFHIAAPEQEQPWRIFLNSTRSLMTVSCAAVGVNYGVIHPPMVSNRHWPLIFTYYDSSSHRNHMSWLLSPVGRPRAHSPVSHRNVSQKFRDLVYWGVWSKFWCSSPPILPPPLNDNSLQISGNCFNPPDASHAPMYEVQQWEICGRQAVPFGFVRPHQATYLENPPPAGLLALRRNGAENEPHQCLILFRVKKTINHFDIGWKI